MIELVLLVLAFTCVCAQENVLAVLFLLGALAVVARKRSNLAESGSVISISQAPDPKSIPATPSGNDLTSGTSHRLEL